MQRQGSNHGISSERLYLDTVNDGMAIASRQDLGRMPICSPVACVIAYYGKEQQPKHVLRGHRC